MLWPESSIRKVCAFIFADLGCWNDFWVHGMTVDRLACYSDSAQQDDDYRSRGLGMFDCEFGGYESGEYRGCEEGGGGFDRWEVGYLG